MSLAAYPEGLPALKRTAQWRDTVAMLLRDQNGAIPDEIQLADPPPEIVELAVPEVLRDLHASGAERLPLCAWPVKAGKTEYLIQDSDIRDAYGNIIGKIASSHWWHVSDLVKLPARTNAGPNIPSQWFVEPLKLACLLRVADAAHIDHRRAPAFLRALLPLSDLSARHWTFQNKLGKPSLDGNLIVYTGGPFELADAEAWWLAYDMINVVDEELHAVNGLLDSRGLHKFSAQGVKGSKSPEAVSQLVTTEKWRPVNTELRVSNVPSLVKLLGGEKLYGDNPTVPLRELIQNAADAIRALRLQLDKPNLGMIRVRVRREGPEWVMIVEDDGIGMSPFVLTGSLLDFGRSFWSSVAIRREFPGLVAKGLKTTGRFGIGFFSVFMLGDRVTVTSRRFDAAAADTYSLDFQGGLKMRPILRAPEPSEILSGPGTRVCVRLRVGADEPKGMLYRGKDNAARILTFTVAETVQRLSPALDVQIEVEEPSGAVAPAISSNDWRTCHPSDLLRRLHSWRTIDSERAPLELRELVDEQSRELHGRACFDLEQKWSSMGIVTIGGFSACSVSGIAGILFGDPQTVSRDKAMPTAPAAVLKSWAAEQVSILEKAKILEGQKLRAAQLAMAFGAAAGKLPIAIQNGLYLNRVAIADAVRDLETVYIYENEEVQYDFDEDEKISPRDFSQWFELTEDLFLIPARVYPLLTVGDAQWPQCVPDLYVTDHSESCLDAFRRVLQDTWNAPLSEQEDNYCVGDVQGNAVFRHVLIFERQGFEDSPDIDLETLLH
jgi:Histidine kinase-, DNA gyrase B-, and HSP90-like ATPase